jgi:hypothetical protein
VAVHYSADKDQYIATVHGKKGVSIPVDNVVVNSGDAIVFLNGMRAGTGTKTTDIKVVYKEGAKCQKGAHMSVGFEIDPKMCYASGWLQPLETSIIVFHAQGVYDYEIQFMDGSAPLKAKVTVQ